MAAGISGKRDILAAPEVVTPSLQGGFNAFRSLRLSATYTEPSMGIRIGYDGPAVGEEGMASSK